MNLAIDIGNTRTKVGVFDGRTLVEKQSFTTLDIPEFIRSTPHQIHHVIVSSVRDQVDVSALGVSGVAVQLEAWTAVPIQSRYQTPETLGKDRLAAVVGAHFLFPNDHACVIDAGTCITYDVVTADGVYIGGNISPGLDMRYRAMHQFTSRLPSVERNDLHDLFGTSTEEALQNGGLIGVLMEIAGYVEVCREQFGTVVPVLTGGDAPYFADRLKTEIFVRPNLVLIGLNEILMMHVAESN
ncbi:MAG: type III pantothenate kinase [Saprospiraceae bacterium]|nr:type III pantothenate kinase [Saprospiraceae bacterium]